MYAICWFLVTIRTSCLDPMIAYSGPSAKTQRLGKNRNLPFMNDKTTTLCFHILLPIHFLLQGGSPGTLSPPLFSLFWEEVKVRSVEVGREQRSIWVSLPAHQILSGTKQISLPRLHLSLICFLVFVFISQFNVVTSNSGRDLCWASEQNLEEESLPSPLFSEILFSYPIRSF